MRFQRWKSSEPSNVSERFRKIRVCRMPARFGKMKVMGYSCPNRVRKGVGVEGEEGKLECLVLRREEVESAG